jgi:hypothetical protein
VGPLLNPATLPKLPAEGQPELRRSPSAPRPSRINDVNQRRGEAYMDAVISALEATAPGGRNSALNRAAWTRGRWIVAGAREQAKVEDALYVAALGNGLVADDGARQCWATIRSGLSAGLQEPVDLDAS